MKILKNNRNEHFLVIKEYDKIVNNRKFTIWLIQFVNTGYTREVYKINAEKGKAKDPYSISVLGIGYEGVFPQKPYHSQAKRLWSNMMKRCYDKKHLKGYFGKGVTVDTRWHSFANFLEDIPKLDGFELWLKGFEKGNIKYNLDKDTIVTGNKVYSKLCCSFIPESINKAEGAKNGKPFTKKKRIKVDSK